MELKFQFNLFFILIALLALVIYIPLIDGSPKRFSNKFIWFSFLGGVISGCSLVVFKIFFFPGFLHEGLISSEILTVTLFVSFIEAGMLEELFKTVFYFLLLFFVFSKSPLKITINLIVLGVLVGLGFGVCENIFYAIQEGMKAEIIWQRNFYSVLAHMIMNGLFGYLFSQRINIVVCFLCAVLWHGIYDFLALPETLLGQILINLWMAAWISIMIYLCWKFWKEKITSNEKIKPI